LPNFNSSTLIYPLNYNNTATIKKLEVLHLSAAISHSKLHNKRKTMKGFGRLISRALLNQKRFELCREINTTCRLTPCRFIHVSSAMAPFLHSRGGAFSDCKTLKSSLHPEKWTLLTGWSVLIEIIVTFCYFYLAV
jgi:hypothetical protein